MLTCSKTKKKTHTFLYNHAAEDQQKKSCSCRDGQEQLDVTVRAAACSPCNTSRSLYVTPPEPHFKLQHSVLTTNLHLQPTGGSCVHSGWSELIRSSLCTSAPTRKGLSHSAVGETCSRWPRVRSGLRWAADVPYAPGQPWPPRSQPQTGGWSESEPRGGTGGGPSEDHGPAEGCRRAPETDPLSDA